MSDSYIETYNELVDSLVKRWTGSEKKLQTEREKVALLREVVGDLIHHFNDYGMESESIACLMAVKKARQALEKLKEREGEE